MKTIELINSLNDGGAETLVREYALYLDKKSNFEVVVATIDESQKSANTKILCQNNIKVFSVFENYNLFNKIYYHLYRDKFIVNRLKKFIMDEKPTCIHAHMWVLKYLAPISDILLRMGISVVYTCHSLPERYFGRGCEDEFRAAECLIKNNHLNIIALHTSMEKELNQLFGEGVTQTVNNCIDVNNFYNVSITKEEERDILGIERSSFVIGHVGRLSKEKNQLFLIDIFVELRKIRKDAFLLLIGDGVLESELRAKLSKYGLNDNYLLLSHRNDVHNVLKAMDVFVFPSLYEGFGNAVIEAQAVGLPCVITENLPNELSVTRNVQRVSLNESEKVWVDSILDAKYHAICRNLFDDFDISSVMKKLQVLYSL